MTRTTRYPRLANASAALRIAVVLVLASGHASSQFSVDGKPVAISHSARAEGLANSYVSEVREVGAMYWNPATLSYLVVPQAAMGVYHVWDGSQLTAYAAVPYRVNKVFTTAIGFTTTNLGDDWTAPTFVHKSIDIAASVRVSRFVSVGALVLLQQDAISTSTLWTASGSIGLVYAPSSGLQYGITYEGLGTGVDYSRYQLHTVKIPPRILRMGTSYSFPLFKSRRYATLTVSGEKHFGIENLHYFVAIEVSPFVFLDFRLGYVQKPDEAIDYMSGARYGMSINTKYVSLDYCVSPSVSALRHHQATILVVIR